MRWLFVILVFLANTSLFAQTKIIGRVLDSDSNAVAYATVRIRGLDVAQTNEIGYFEFDIPKGIQESHYLKGGIDLSIDVEKEGWAILDPPDRMIRLPEDWNLQKCHILIIAPKGSHLFYQAESMLEYIMNKRIEEAMLKSEQDELRRDIFAIETKRLGLNKGQLQTAVEAYKNQ